MVKAILQGGSQATFGFQGLTLESLLIPLMLNSKLGSQLPGAHTSVCHPEALNSVSVPVAGFTCGD